MKKATRINAVILALILGCSLAYAADRVVVIPVVDRCCTCKGTLNGTRWCDNGDGTVTDMLGYNGKGKCLVWLKKAGWGGALPWRVNEVDAYDDAHTRAGLLKAGSVGADLSDGSLNGEWRLPTSFELYALAHGGEAVRSGNMRAFTGVQASAYWSSSTPEGYDDRAAAIFLNDGSSAIGFKYIFNWVWPVRAGQ